MSLLFSIQLVWAAPIQSSTAYYDTYVKVGNIGNYEFIMETHEIPSHEVLPIVGKEYFPRTAATYISEVDNTPPDAIYKAKTISKVDVVFAFGDSSKASAIQDLIPSFTTALQSASNSVDAYVEQVETSTISMADAGAAEIFQNWQNYPDDSGQWVYDAATNTIGSTRNVGWTGFWDSRQEAVETTDVVIEYDSKEVLRVTGMGCMPETGYEKFSGHPDPMGFTFRMTHDPVDGYSYYAFAIYAYQGVAVLCRINDVQNPNSAIQGCVAGFTSEIPEHVGVTNGVTTQLGFRRINYNPMAEHHIKISAQGNHIIIDYDGTTIFNVIDDSTDALMSGSYGPFTFSTPNGNFYNISVTSGGTKTLGAAISDVHWRDNSTRFVIYCDDTIPEYMETTDNTDYQYTVTKLLNSNIYLINICTATNLDTLAELIKFISIDGENKGISIYNQTPSKSLTTAKDWILSKVENLSKPEDWILVNDEVIWETEYFDQEKDLPLNFGEHDGTKNSDVSDQQLAEAWGVGLTHLYTSDKIQAEKWRYRHFNNYFDNSTIRESFHNIWIADPVEIFPNPGLYRINYKRKDNPLHPDISQDNVFDNYRYWSKHYDRLPNFEGA